MSSSSAKVGEIFTTAGAAFNHLGELTLQLSSESSLSHGNKWTDEEIDLLRSAVSRFNDDLNNISTRIKSHTTAQIRQTLKNKAFDDAGVKQQIIVQSTPQQQLLQNHPRREQMVVQREQLIQYQTNSHMEDDQLDEMLDEDEETEEEMHDEGLLNSANMTLNRLNAHEQFEEADDSLGASDVKLEFTEEVEVTG